MNNNNSQTIGNRIRKAREKLKISQSELSSMMCLSRTMCGQWERSTSVPSTLHLSRLADLLDVSFEYLAKGKDLTTPKQSVVIEKSNQEKILKAKMNTFFDKITFTQKQNLVALLGSMVDEV